MNLKNRVQLIGNLGAAPKIKELKEGRKMARFSVATNSVEKRNGKFEKTVNWYNVTAWGKTAEIVEQKLSKGSEVIIEGKLVSNSYTDLNGNVRKFYEVLAENLLYRNIKTAIAKAENSENKTRA